jgi:hypothetical protein
VQKNIVKVVRPLLLIKEYLIGLVKYLISSLDSIFQIEKLIISEHSEEILTTWIMEFAGHFLPAIHNLNKA